MCSAECARALARSSRTGADPAGALVGYSAPWRWVGRRTDNLSAGGVRERPNRTVSKTVVPPGTVGSNPTASAGSAGWLRHRAARVHPYPVGASDRPPAACRWGLIRVFCSSWPIPHSTGVSCRPPLPIWASPPASSPAWPNRASPRRSPSRRRRSPTPWPGATSAAGPPPGSGKTIAFGLALVARTSQGSPRRPAGPGAGAHPGAGLPGPRRAGRALR